jgi:hypothetical protein
MKLEEALSAPKVEVFSMTAMRTLPKSLSNFRHIVKRRGEQLRLICFEQLNAFPSTQTESLTVDSREARITIFVRPQLDGSVRVVVQGFVAARIVPDKHVALDGFYKIPDESTTPMPDEELYQFD